MQWYTNLIFTYWEMMAGTYWKSLFSVIKRVCFSEDRKLCTIKTLQFMHTVSLNQGVSAAFVGIVWCNGMPKAKCACCVFRTKVSGEVPWFNSGKCGWKRFASCEFWSLCIQKHFVVSNVLMTSIFSMESASQFEKLGMNITESNLENER